VRLFIPRGPDRLKDGYNWLATWTNSGKDELLARSLAARTDQLVVAIEAFRALRPTQGKPIVVGFSQGGILSFGLAVRHPKYFSAAFPISGWLPPSLLPKQLDENITYPFIHALHGSEDVIVPTMKDRDSILSLRRLGIFAEFTEVPGVGHTVTPEMNEIVRKWVHQMARSFVVSRAQAADKSN
jgi:phospholipase/carboxylesterase